MAKYTNSLPQYLHGCMQSIPNCLDTAIEQFQTNSSLSYIYKMVLRGALSQYSVIVMVPHRKNAECGKVERTFITNSLFHTKQCLWLCSLHSPFHSESNITLGIHSSLRIHLYTSLLGSSLQFHLSCDSHAKLSFFMQH